MSKMIIARHSQQGLSELTRIAGEHNMQPLAAAFRHLTFQTGNIPMTEGYKMSLRHLGAALNIHDGPLAVFLTTNFADTYSPITVTLMN